MTEIENHEFLLKGKARWRGPSSGALADPPQVQTHHFRLELEITPFGDCLAMDRHYLDEAEARRDALVLKKTTPFNYRGATILDVHVTRIDRPKFQFDDERDAIVRVDGGLSRLELRPRPLVSAHEEHAVLTLLRYGIEAFSPAEYSDRMVSHHSWEKLTLTESRCRKCGVYRKSPPPGEWMSRFGRRSRGERKPNFAAFAPSLTPPCLPDERPPYELEDSEREVTAPEVTAPEQLKLFF